MNNHENKLGNAIVFGFVLFLILIMVISSTLNEDSPNELEPRNDGNSPKELGPGKEIDSLNEEKQKPEPNSLKEVKRENNTTSVETKSETNSKNDLCKNNDSDSNEVCVCENKFECGNDNGCKSK